MSLGWGGASLAGDRHWAGVISRPIATATSAKIVEQRSREQALRSNRRRSEGVSKRDLCNDFSEGPDRNPV